MRQDIFHMEKEFMNLKLVKNDKPSQCFYHSDRLVLKISDDNYMLADYAGKKYMLHDIEENTMMEVAPAIKKFDFIEIVDLVKNEEYVFFISAKMVRENVAGISLYRYCVSANEASEIYFFEVNIEEFLKKYTFKFFIIDDNYAFIQTSEKENGRNCKNRLLIMENGSTIAIKDELFANAGITEMVKLKDNLFGIHLGGVLHNHCDAKSGESTDTNERLVILNVKQFISDLLLEKDNITAEVIDEGSIEKHYPYVKVFRDYMIYSRFYYEDCREEIVFYDYNTNTKKVRMILADGEVSNRENIYLLGGIPYMLDYSGNHYVLINLDSQKEEYVFNENIDVKTISNDFIIVQEAGVSGLLKRETSSCCCFRWPEMETEIFKEKGTFAGSVTTKEDLIIFLN